jgi:hypothetical protein
MVEKKKNPPAFFAVQQRVLTLIKERDNINHRVAISKLKDVCKEATGEQYVKGGDKSWLQTLEETEKYLKKKK